MTEKDYLKKIFVKNDRKMNKKDTTKEERKALKKINKKILELLEEKECNYEN